MKLLVTGAAGFVGSHVTTELAEQGHEVIALVRLSTIGDMRRFESCNGARLRFVYHDLKYPVTDGLREQIGDVDAVLHLGANSHVDRSITHPKEFYLDNVMGTVNLLEYVREHQKDARVINFGTDEVFGPAPQGYSFKEEDRYRPSNPYSASKAGQVCAGHSYHITYGLDLITVYPTNIFGEGQNVEKFIPLIIRNVWNQRSIPVHSKLDENGEVEYVGSRCWLYVKNIANCLMFLLENGHAGEHYNLVGDVELTNDLLVKKIAHILNMVPTIDYVDFHKTRPGHDRRYALDRSKLESLGWVPPCGFEKALENTVNWFVNQELERKQFDC